MHLFVAALASLFASFAVGYEVHPTSGPPYTPKCFTCPQASKISGEKPEYVNLVPNLFDERPWSCSYWVNGYEYETGDKKKKWQKERFIGKCDYSAATGKLLSGPKGCSKEAAKDASCTAVEAHNKDKGTYLKKCDQNGCGYETAACYTCPKVQTDRVNIDTRNNKLECKYYTGETMDDHCSYDGSTGTLTGNKGGKSSPFQCPKKAAQDSPCLVQLQKDQDWQAALASDKKAAEDDKQKAAQQTKFRKENGLWAVGCEDTLKMIFPGGTRALIGEKPVDVCRDGDPERLLAKLKPLGIKTKIFTDYVEGLEASIKKKTPEEKKAEARDKFQQEKGLWAVGCAAVLKDLFPGSLGTKFWLGEKDELNVCQAGPEKLLERLKKIPLNTKKFTDYVKGLEQLVKKKS